MRRLNVDAFFRCCVNPISSALVNRVHERVDAALIDYTHLEVRVLWRN
jgi:hypothetical protein